MDLQLLVIGKTGSAVIEEATKVYTGRLKHYLPFEIKVLADVKNTKGMTVQQQKEAEGRVFMNVLQNSDFVVLLDERGKEYTSVGFAEYLEGKMVSGLKRMVFVVGGPYGFSEDMYMRANGKVSLSKMTFSHEMIRLFFAEQVYRAMTILRHEPYHHE